MQRRGPSSALDPTVERMTTEFTDQELRGARFEHVDLTGATFQTVDLAGTRWREVALRDMKVRGAFVADLDISGEVLSLRVNGVDVVPLVEAELDRLHPERAKLHPTDAEGFREAWVVIEGLWAETVERARALDPAALHGHVEDEWSFIETLRHLVFATDCWLLSVLLGDPAPWDPLSLPWDEMPDTEGVPRDRDVRPSLDEVLPLRADRMGSVRRYLDDLTDEQLARSTTPVAGVGPPPPDRYPVRRWPSSWTRSGGTGASPSATSTCSPVVTTSHLALRRSDDRHPVGATVGRQRGRPPGRRPGAVAGDVPVEGRRA